MAPHQLPMYLKFCEVFKTPQGQLSALHRYGSESVLLGVLVCAGDGSQLKKASLVVTGQSPIESFELEVAEFGSSLFIPTRDTLALYEGFIAAYTNRELSFDETYFDLCVALSASPLKGAKAEWGRDLLERLNDTLQASVKLSDGRFYVGDHPAHLVAEGSRKIAMLYQLIRNGGISEGCTLFWDEPESGLNPRLVKVIADLLKTLAEHGVQIILATHDYLLTSELSLAAEYGTTKAPIRFFCLSKESPDAAVTAESGDTLADLEHNPIVEEFAAMYDREAALFRQANAASEVPVV